MLLSLQSSYMEDYLANTDEIDFSNKEIRELADRIKAGCNSEIELIKAVYEFVRDNVSHSGDINGDVVTCKASEVLKHMHGTCYAKSHLLAALLRYLGVHTGLCYQRLILDDDLKPCLILHGLNAVYIKGLDKWVRLDARGNKDGVKAEFSIEDEILAFPVRIEKGEEDIPVIYAHPDSNVIASLKMYSKVSDLFDDLPRELKQISGCKQII